MYLEYPYNCFDIKKKSFAIILVGNLSKLHSVQSNPTQAAIWYFSNTNSLLMFVIYERKHSNPNYIYSWHYKSYLQTLKDVLLQEKILPTGDIESLD